MKRLKNILPIILLLIFSCNEKEEMSYTYFKVEGNPLFNDFNKAIDFDKLTADHIVEATDTIIAQSRSALQKIYEVEEGQRTFDNTMLALDDMSNDIGRISSVIHLMAYTHPDSAVRTNAQDASTRLEKFGNEISLDERLYKAVKDYSGSVEAGDLPVNRAKYLRETVEDFERNGFALSDEKRAELKIIKDSISEIGNDFDKNIAGYEDYLIVNEEEIKGLSEDYKSARRQEDGTYKIDLSYPSYRPFMKYSESDEARRQLYMKYNNRAADKNLEVLKQLLVKREEMADLLGYDSYAWWRMENRMAKNPKTVWDFEENLISSVQPKADQDYQEMLEAKRQYLGEKDADRVKPWEASYIENILLEEKYQVDDEKIKEYFSLDHSLDGLFQITQSIFGVTFKEMESPSVWHEEVRGFEVFDEGKLIGRFYLDFFPRENKYKHAACFGMIKGKQTPLGYQIPNATLVCNFPPPTEDKPSLMPHSQVETLFHEFGHVLHQMLTEAELYSQSGTSVARDFVEAPSQIFENWAWNYESLKLFAKHYETGEVLPKDLYDKMQAAKNVGSGLYAEAQILYGLIDLTLHDRFNPVGEKNTDDVVEELRNEITHYPYVEGTHFQAAFGHLNGYGASYYGYLWSKVYAEDMFSVFEKNGVLDKDTGMKFRKTILARGSSQEPMELVEEFLGREPNNNAFMKSLGLESEKI